MKKILSLALVALMLASALPVAYAANVCPACGGSNFRAYEHSDCERWPDCLDCGYCPGCTESAENGTEVIYYGRQQEYYEISVPATMAPGASNKVEVHGAWASNRQLNVTADSTVTMVNSLNSKQTKTLSVTLDEIALLGNDIDDSPYTYHNIAVSDISDALFGTWSGKFYYYAEIVDVGPALISFTVNEPGNQTKTYQAEEGMTWADWVESDYCTVDYYCVDCDEQGDSLHGYGWIDLDGYSQSATDTLVANAEYTMDEW